MRDDACRKKINKIEISNLGLKEGATLAVMLEETFGKTDIEYVIITHKAAGKIIGDKEKMTRDLGKDPISLESIENWKNGKITQEFTCPRGAVTEAKYVPDEIKTAEVNASKIRKGLCKEMVLKALRQEPVLESDIKGVEESPDELCGNYIEPENYDKFHKIGLDTTPFKFPEEGKEAEHTRRSVDLLGCHLSKCNNSKTGLMMSNSTRFSMGMITRTLPWPTVMQASTLS